MKPDQLRARALSEVARGRMRLEEARLEVDAARGALVDLEMVGVRLAAEARRAHRYRHARPGAPPPLSPARDGDPGSVAAGAPIIGGERRARTDIDAAAMRLLFAGRAS